MNFSPALIVETTSVCDRACAGCYAPNLVSKESPAQVLKSMPHLFLKPESLTLALSHFDGIDSVALRGGEPTRHPLLANLIQISSANAQTVYIETHGRWLLDEANAHTEDLLSVIKSTGAVVKLSFDSMHGLAAEDLKVATDRLASRDIGFLVAITEPDEASFQRSLFLCSFIPKNKIVFQNKIFVSEQLIQPKLGVIGVDGQIRNSLNSKLRSTSIEKQLVAL